MDERRIALTTWLHALGIASETLAPASEDASFRRYWRVTLPDGTSRIVMDAPPEREPIHPWLRLRGHLERSGVPVPAVEAVDEEQGFVLMSDLGRTTVAAHLTENPEAAHETYAEALAVLVVLQASARPEGVPDYDEERLLAELRLFPEWYLARHLGVTLTPRDAEALEAVFTALVRRARGQPQLLVHRDYHSRNLMVLPENHPLRERAMLGVLDFQDAVWGPVTYDPVSLLRDAYLEWPEEFALDLLVRYWQQARRLGIPIHERFDDFYADYEWMGVQRHLKVLGIFARLAYRDGKTGFLNDLPRVRRYLWKALLRYSALKPLRRLFEQLHPEEVAVALTF
ncbi:aminoglycoside phosphotransferase family protein [Hydrogenophilus islandicus]